MMNLEPILDRLLEDGDTPECKMFITRGSGENAHLGGTAELSQMDAGLVGEMLERPVSGIWYDFNRLFVPPRMGRQEVASGLMQQVVEWADANDVNIFNGVNPYGDLNMQQLVAFYKRYGFEQVTDIPEGEYLLIRQPGGKR